jgi:hypothetical protein
MALQTACPNRDRLRELLDGDLPEDHEPGLISHLDVCAACQQTLQELAAGGESWEGAARELRKEAPTADPALGRVLRDLQSNGITGETQAEPAGAAELPLDFLAPPNKPGQLGVLDHYEVLEVIGRGGMGVVLKAFDRKLQRVVAVKVLAPQLAASSAARRRFDREARAAAAVAHDHVVAIHAVEGDRPLPYLVMHYVAGMSLQERLDRSGPLEIKEILRIGMQTAAGLAAAHAQGLVHRDVKPANILLENGVERVKLTDFGLARAVDDASVSQSGVVAGTPQYMAPEQARGETVDHRADLFSLGSVLYALCAGRPPFRASSVMAVLKRVCEEEPRPVREVNPEVPEWLAAIIAKLHAKNPDDRFQSAAEVADLLGRHLAHLQHPSQAPMPAPVAVPPAALPAGRVRWTPQELSSFATILIAVGAVLVVLAWLPGGMNNVPIWITVLCFAVPLLGIMAATAGYLFVKTRRQRRMAGQTPSPTAQQTAALAPRRWRRWLWAAVSLPVLAGLTVVAVNLYIAWEAARPVDDAWVAGVQALPPDQQVEAVRQKLQALNPGFDGNVRSKAEEGEVVELFFSSAGVTDLSPLRALRALRFLSCPGPSFTVHSRLADLTPLRGLPLTKLSIHYTAVEDLAPLQDMPLQELYCYGTPVKDLSALRGTPLRLLDAGWTRISDLSPLEKLPLTWLHCDNTPVGDLSPLRGKPLTELDCHNTRVTDLSPLGELPLVNLRCDIAGPGDVAVIVFLRNLQTINETPIKDWMKQYVEPDHAWTHGFDPAVDTPADSSVSRTADGWQIAAGDPRAVYLFDVPPERLMPGRLTFRAEVKVQNEGRVPPYLLCECEAPGLPKKHLGYGAPLTPSDAWAGQEVSAFLHVDHVPHRVRLLAKVPRGIAVQLRKVVLEYTPVDFNAQSVVQSDRPGPGVHVKTLGSLTGHMYEACGAAFSADGARLATGDQTGQIQLWGCDAEGKWGPEAVPALWAPDEVWRLAFSPDNKTLAAAGLGKNVWQWKWEQTWRKGPDLPFASSMVRGLVVLPGGRTVVAAGGHFGGHGPGELTFWDAASGEQLAAPDWPLADTVQSLALSPDGRTLITARNGWVELWDAANRHWRGAFPAVADVGAAFLGGDDAAATASAEGVIRRWMRNGADWTERAAALKHGGPIHAFAVSPDGRLAATGGDDGVVKLWDLEAVDQVATLHGHASVINYAVFSPDGKTLATCSRDGTVKLWGVTMDAKTDK